MSYKPGPNFDPVNATLKGWPTPLKFVSCDLINSFTTGSNVSFLNSSIAKILFLNSVIIILAFSSINFKSSSLNLTSSWIINFALLYISCNA